MFCLAISQCSCFWVPCMIFIWPLFPIWFPRLFLNGVQPRVSLLVFFFHLVPVSVFCAQCQKLRQWPPLHGYWSGLCPFLVYCFVLLFIFFFYFKLSPCMSQFSLLYIFIGFTDASLEHFSVDLDPLTTLSLTNNPNLNSSQRLWKE